MKFNLSLFIGLVGAVSSATAGTITYNINFTTTGGLAPLSGTFTYDLTLNTFTNFLVTWDGTTFDLRSEANSPGINTFVCPTANFLPTTDRKSTRLNSSHS